MHSWKWLALVLALGLGACQSTHRVETRVGRSAFEILYSGPGGDEIDWVEVRNLTGAPKVTRIEIYLFDDDGDGQYQEGERRGHRTMTQSPEDWSGRYVRFFNMSLEGVENPMLYVLIETQDGVETVVTEIR